MPPNRAAAHLAVEFLHGHEVQRLQGVARGRYKVQTRVDTGVVVAVQCALDLQLLLQIRFKLGVNKLYDGLVAVREAPDPGENDQSNYLFNYHMCFASDTV